MSNQSKKRHYGGFRLENNNNDVKLKYNFDLSAPIIRLDQDTDPCYQFLPVSVSTALSTPIPLTPPAQPGGTAQVAWVQTLTSINRNQGTG